MIITISKFEHGRLHQAASAFIQLHNMQARAYECGAVDAPAYEKCADTACAELQRLLGNHTQLFTEINKAEYNGILAFAIVLCTQDKNSDTVEVA